MKHFGTLLIAVLWLTAITGCAGGNLTTREKGAGIGALGGAAVGGIIGATVGAPGSRRCRRRCARTWRWCVDRRPTPRPGNQTSGPAASDR